MSNEYSGTVSNDSPQGGLLDGLEEMAARLDEALGVLEKRLTVVLAPAFAEGEVRGEDPAAKSRREAPYRERARGVESRLSRSLRRVNELTERVDL